MASANATPEILICNDDGVYAPGLHSLIEAAKPYGHVTVVAPDSPQSGMGHAISIGEPLRLYKQDLGLGVTSYACSGTPVDCVKLARTVILHRKPDLLVSGINHGANFSVSVLYSGTMSAAVEGAIENIPSIGLSLLSYRNDADFTASRYVAQQLIGQALQRPFPSYTALNVNIPYVGLDQLKGIRITRQAQGRFAEEFDQRVDPYGRDYYWLAGKFELNDEGEDTDEWALSNGYVSVCPVQIDMTAHHLMGRLNQWHLNEAFLAPDEAPDYE
jgi:5'-nucleotidase